MLIGGDFVLESSCLKNKMLLRITYMFSDTYMYVLYSTSIFTQTRARAGGGGVVC